MSIAEPQPLLPTHLDLPFKDDIPVDNFFQPEQTFLLTGSLVPHLDRLHGDGNYLIGANSGIYWALKKEPLSGCRAPDWYFVPDVPRTLDGVMRRSYVMWHEKVPPLLVVEFVSSGDGSNERDITQDTGKFWVYERGIKAGYYAIHDPFRCTLEVHKLRRGRYQTMTPDANGRFRIPPMALDLGIWEGVYHGYTANWLRAWDQEGKLIPLLEESLDQQQRLAEQQKQLARQERQRADKEKHLAELEKHRADVQKQIAEQEKQRAEQEKQRAEQEKQRAEALAARLRALGIDPDGT